MIPAFFENKNIFVTGGSGVVGKAVIEKLLRSCNVGKIYILLRPKKNYSIEERLEQLKGAMIFRQLRLQKPDELDKKLICIPGEATQPMLGITPEYQKLLENVNIVFHCAATVKFDEALINALRLNLGGTFQMLKFAETLKHLEVVMHVSTFFSNPYLKRIEDRVYESPMDWRLCLKLLERNDISDEQLDTITRKLIIGFPNTYCFTKNLAESLVNDYRSKLPVAIYRPSVILFALEDPEPGFSPSLMGAMGLFAVTGAGLLKTIYLNRRVPLDISPQDMVVKSLCFYTVKTANIYRNMIKSDQIPVYMTSSCTHTDKTFAEYTEIMQDNGFWEDGAFEKNLFIPGIYCTDSYIVYIFLVMLLQLLPALLIDFALVLSGRKPVLMSVHRRIYTTLEITRPFLFNYYESSGVTDANEMLSKLRGTDFSIDIISTLKNYYPNVGICQPVPYNIREHLLREDPKTVPRSRKILQAKIFLYKILKFLLAFKVYEKLVDSFGYFWSEKLSFLEKENSI